MLQQYTLKFLKDLQNNNNKPWFENNRVRYEEARADFVSFVERLIPGLASIDDAMSSLQAKNCIFRINRDVRFSNNKTPYKNNMSAYFNKAGKKGNGGGYYIHIEPGGSFAAAGIWMPESADLAKIRQEIDYNLDDWKKIISHKNFKKTFENGLDSSEILVRPPKGYTEDNPALPFLKLKSFVIRSSFSDADIMDRKFEKEVIKKFQAAHPLVSFLNRALD